MSKLDASLDTSNIEIELKKIYPKVLENPKLETEKDDTSFTLPEKVALKSAWRFLQPENYRLSRRLFVEFYVEHEMLIERFRFTSGKICVKSFVNHAFLIFKTLSALVFNGLESQGHIVNVLREFVLCHQAHKIAQEELILLLEAFGKCFMSFIEMVDTPTLNNAMHKLFLVVQEAHLQGRMRGSIPRDIFGIYE